jgi:hypothetical protein
MNKFLNDEYTLDIDQLGYKKQTDTIRKLIIADTPFSLGISGRWGSGKTSVMKYLMASLGGEPLKHRLNFHTKTIEEKSDFKQVINDNEDYKNDIENIHTIWFNPWENENHTEPMIGLLQSIYNHFSFLAEAKRETEKILSVTIQSGLDMIGSLLKLGKNQGTNIKEIGEKYEYDNFQHIERNQKFKFIFQEAIETLLIEQDQDKLSEPNQNARIVIFIDDLDRCEDETIGKLLKEIKQYLSTKRCIFVFGYDRHHIEKSLSKTEIKTNKETRAYLEKLFQTTFYIKEPKGDKLKSFIKDITKEYQFINESDQEEFISFIISIIDPNPRRIKSYLTTMYFHTITTTRYERMQDIGDETIKIEDLKKLALITYLKIFYESVYSSLENQPKLLKDLISTFGNRKIFDISNQREYYFHLEFKSHLHEIDIEEYKDKVEYSIDYEDKFLNEIYEMQGKHKSFENFMIQFIKLFENEHHLEKYI